jgi:transcriptional regulator with XRE-family HTH domain
MSKEVLLEKLTDPTYREAFISEEIDTGIPMQLRAMREKRGWNQKYIAGKMNTKQPRFSLMEKPGYGNFSLNTLKKLATIFNVGLIVSFVPFSEMIDFVEGFSRKRLEIPSFGDEYVALEKRYGRAIQQFASDSIQGNFYFAAETSETVNSSTEGLTATTLASLDEATASANASTPLKAEPESPYGTSAPIAVGQAVGI